MADVQTLLGRSDALHSRVQDYIRAANPKRAAFEALALEIAQFQAEFNPGFARLVKSRGSRLDSVSAIPAVPVDAFRLARVAVHPPELDIARYRTSGTTSEQPGLHNMRRTDTYEISAIAWAREGLFANGASSAAVAALLPEGGVETSSLSAMANMFMLAFDRNSDGSPMPSRWVLRPEGIDVAGLVAHLERARASQQPFIVVATVIALVQLLEDLGERTLDVWPQTVVMPTGGFKGKIREIASPELREGVARAFGIPDANIVGEYGMTELGSQLYEGFLPGGSLAGIAGYFHAPPWLDVCPVDPETLEHVHTGDVGIARFVDLANVDSAVCIVTQDLIRDTEHGIELLGRRQGAVARGCSLSTEEWLNGTVRA